MSHSTVQKEMFAGKATLYFHHEIFGNIIKVETKEVRFWRAPFAQYANAVFVEFRKPQQRKFRTIIQYDHLSVLVLEGWGHPEPDSFMGPAHRSESTPDISVAVARYSSFDPRWTEDFNRMIDAHIEKAKARKIADFRGFADHQR